MTGNLICQFKIIDPTKETLKYLSERGININEPSKIFSENEFHYEEEFSIEIFDGSMCTVNKKTVCDMVFAVNMTKEAIKAYDGPANWFCFDHINTLNRFLEALYYSFNCDTVLAEYDYMDLVTCISSNKDLFRIIYKKDSLDKLNTSIRSLMVFKRYSKATCNTLDAMTFWDLIEKTLNEEAIFIYNAVLPYVDTVEGVDFFYTEE